MKKYLLSVLTSIVLIPTVGNAVSQIDTYHKNATNQQNLSNLKKNTANFVDVNGNINWNNVDLKVNDDINSINKTNSINSDALQAAKKQAQEYTDNFKAQNFSLDQANQYLKANNEKFNNNFSNKNNNFTNLKDEISNEYFVNTKIDLNLHGSDTYQNVLNILQNKILNEYSNANIKMTLADPTQANATLFNSDDISNFINNNLTVKLNVQFDNDKPVVKTLSLTNIQLDAQKEATQLDQCVKWYFSQDNSQDLNLTANNTRADALTALMTKINQRFNIKIGNDLSSNTGIQMDFVNKPEANSKFIDNENLNYVVNQNFWFDVNIKDNNLTSSNNQEKVSLYLSNISFDFTSMNLALNRLFLTGASANNLQNLGLTTDNTFQDVIDKLNNNFSKLDKTDSFVATLTDPSQASQTLLSIYHPGEDNFFANVNLGFKEAGQIINIGNSDIHLGNVQLSPTALKIKEAYQEYNKFLDTMKTISLALEVSATVFSVAAAAAFVGAFFDPALADYAWTLTAADYILVLATVGFNTAIWSSEKNLSFWENLKGIGLGIIFGAARVMGGTIYTLWTTTVEGLSVISRNFLIAALVETLIGVGATLYAILEYFGVISL